VSWRACERCEDRGLTTVSRSQRPHLFNRQDRIVLVAGNDIEARDDHFDRVSRGLRHAARKSWTQLLHSLLYRTPAGVGWSSEPKNLLQDGDEFSVYISHGVGTLITKIEAEK
jgi:hypothetical protein